MKINIRLGPKRHGDYNVSIVSINVVEIIFTNRIIYMIPIAYQFDLCRILISELSDFQIGKVI